MSQTLSLNGYASLRTRVRVVLLLGRQRIEEAKVRTYWETGRLIDRYIQTHTPVGKERAEYNKQIVERLADDLDIHETVLYRCVRFAQQFKKVAGRQLSWSHYRALLGITDEEKRWELLDRAEKSEWTSETLESEVKKINDRLRESSNGHVEKSFDLLTPRKGVPYTYRLIRTEKIHAGKSKLKLDLGFSSFKEASMKGVDSLKAGDIAESIWAGGDTYRLKKAAGKTEKDLFAYYAEVERVVDGDTIIVQVDLGFGITTRQYLRLRGIDTPEISKSRRVALGSRETSAIDPAGLKAKHFVESELKSVSYVTITSTKSDKYDRYLADVFYEKSKQEYFLNNELLKRGLAMRVE